MASQGKQVYFNVETEQDLLEFANSIKPSFSSWVKDHIRKAIETTKGQTNSKTTTDLPRKL
jgi:hypothetical protein